MREHFHRLRVIGRRTSRECLVASIDGAAKAFVLGPLLRTRALTRPSLFAGHIDRFRSCLRRAAVSSVCRCLPPSAHGRRASPEELRCGPSDECVRFDSTRVLQGSRGGLLLQDIPRPAPPPISTQPRSVRGGGRRKQPSPNATALFRRRRVYGINLAALCCCATSCSVLCVARYVLAPALDLLCPRDWLRV